MQQLLTILEHIFLFALKDNEKGFFALLVQIEEFCPDAAEFSVKVRETSHLKTQMGKARAWLRLAMIQKKLEGFMSVLIDQKEILREYYENGAILLEEDSAMLHDTIIQLSCIDCHLSIGESADLDGPVGNIDYSLLQQRKASLPDHDIGNTGSVSDDDHSDLSLSLDELLEEQSKQLADTLKDTEQKSDETSQREFETLQQQIKDSEAEKNLYKKENEGLQSELDMIQQEKDIQSGHSCNGADQPTKRAVSIKHNSETKLSEKLITTGGGWEMTEADFGEVKNNCSHQVPITEPPKPAQPVLKESTDNCYNDESLDLGRLASLEDWSLLTDAPPEPQAANALLPMACPSPQSIGKELSRWMRGKPAVQEGDTLSKHSTDVLVGAVPTSEAVSAGDTTASEVCIGETSKHFTLRPANDIYAQRPVTAEVSTQTGAPKVNVSTQTDKLTQADASTETVVNAHASVQTETRAVATVSAQTDTPATSDASPQTVAQAPNDVTPPAELPLSHPSMSVAELPGEPQPSAASAVSTVLDLRRKDHAVLNDVDKYNSPEQINLSFIESTFRALAERASPAGSNSGPQSTAGTRNQFFSLFSALEKQSSDVNADNKIPKEISLYKESHGMESEHFHSIPTSADVDSISSDGSVTPFQSCVNEEESETTDDVIVEIAGYVEREWKGATSKAEQIRQGYASVMDEHRFKHIARIRGDNYCALRATFASVVLNNVQLNLPLEQTLQRLESMTEVDPSLLRSWRFPECMSDISADKSYDELHECLLFMISKMSILPAMEDPTEKRKELCKLLNTGGSEELYVLEGMKVLMMISAYELHKLYTAGQEVPVFTWLMFARDTSETPELFLKNHLNSVGRDSGVEQVEMCLLGYSLGITLQTFRLYQHGEVDFIALYPEDDSPETLVPVIAEDDRHYNTLVKLNT